MKINASIVLFNNNQKEIDSIIESFISSKYSNYIFLVDNSTKNTKYTFNNPKVKYFKNKNVGYGSGHNIAIKKSMASSDYHIVLNPDIYFESKVIDGLAEYLEKEQEIGLCMPKILSYDNELQYLCKLLPNPLDLFSRRFFGKSNTLYEMRNFDYSQKMSVPSLSGCFMFFRTKVFSEVGLFDERYFIYCEDLDLSRRVYDSSFTNVYNPDFIVHHLHNRESYKNVKMLIIHIKSVIKYFNKWGWFFYKKRGVINKKARQIY